MIKYESQAITCLRPLLYAAAMVIGGLLVPLVWLREDPHFWTDAGEYPRWTRDLVMVAYYPLLLVYCGLLAFLSWLLLCRHVRSVRQFYGQALVLLLLWAVLALVTMLMIANNLANLFDGRPLHAH